MDGAERSGGRQRAVGSLPNSSAAGVLVPRRRGWPVMIPVVVVVVVGLPGFSRVLSAISLGNSCFF